MQHAVALVGALMLAATAASPAGASAPGGASRGGVLPPEAGSRQDSVLVQAKRDGRARIARDGRVEILPVAPDVDYPSSERLDTTWTGLAWEPPGTGTDDASEAYADDNYWNFCGPGATAVALWYWNGAFVEGVPTAEYTEPNPDLAIRAATTWAASNSVSTSRGAIMFLAEKVLPDRVEWDWPGIIDWSRAYPYNGTPVNRIAEALNWMISGDAAAGPYVWAQFSAQLSEAALLDYVHQDVGGAAVPLIANVATAAGRYHLPNWRPGRSVNHSIAIVGYDDGAGTYTYVDTCGPGCNNAGSAAGVYDVSQRALWNLLRAESDGDGIVF